MQGAAGKQWLVARSLYSLTLTSTPLSSTYHSTDSYIHCHLDPLTHSPSVSRWSCPCTYCTYLAPPGDPIPNPLLSLTFQSTLLTSAPRERCSTRGRETVADVWRFFTLYAHSPPTLPVCSSKTAFVSSGVPFALRCDLARPCLAREIYTLTSLTTLATPSLHTPVWVYTRRTTAQFHLDPSQRIVSFAHKTDMMRLFSSEK
ncbi:hypothetical protein BJ166DRAFT_153007 [Pestalotiopsis sp. NC0098]|nr:hypothetical protein BJ166DRAFT_153007 [Pestalotiopsis sp. NC0098]